MVTAAAVAIAGVAISGISLIHSVSTRTKTMTTFAGIQTQVDGLKAHVTTSIAGVQTIVQSLKDQITALQTTLAGEPAEQDLANVSETINQLDAQLTAFDAFNAPAAPAATA